MGHRQVLESLFVAMISSTVVSTALPLIIGSLNGTQTRCTWVVTAPAHPCASGPVNTGM